MAANVETMFSVREVPWHKLGRIIQEAPNSNDALKEAGLDWQVVAKDVTVDNKVVEGYKANVRNSDGLVLGVVTDKYKVVQNADAFAFTDALVGTGDVRYETAGALASGKRVWLLAKLPDMNLLGDKTTPYLVFTNSHDGRGAVKIAVTPIRVVCQNTLNIALEGAKRMWSTIHTGNMENKLQEAQRTLEMTSDYLGTLAGEAEKMAQIAFTKKAVGEFVEMLLPINMVKDGDQKIETIKDLREELLVRYNEAPDLKKFRGTGWGLINAVSDLVTHTQPRRDTKTFLENRFCKIVDGHEIMDAATKLIYRAA